MTITAFRTVGIASLLVGACVAQPAPELTLPTQSPVDPFTVIDSAGDLEPGTEGAAVHAIAEDEAAPTIRQVDDIERTLLLTPSAADFSVGGASLEFPAGSVSDSVDVTVRLPASPPPDRLPPLGTVLGSMDSAPWSPPLEQTAVVRIPLTRDVPADMQLELLSWQPAMRAYLVVATGYYDPDTQRASFGVRQLSTFIVRPAPVQREDSRDECADTPLRIGRSWPGPSEDAVVGLVPEDDRMPRATAFQWLTDLRVAADPTVLEFKNEEVRNSGATRADERDHQDEDFLMDPAAAAATLTLAELVSREWVDPLSGEPAYRVRVTEAYDSLIEHSRQSTHYHGRAVDLTLSPVPSTAGDAREHFYGRLASLSVCAGYDYVLFENAYHVHVSVKPTRVLIDDGQGGQFTARVQNLEHWYRQPPGTTAAAGAVTPDSLRELLVDEGLVWLSYTEGRVPMGSENADGTPVPMRYPQVLHPVTTDASRARWVPDSRAWSTTRSTAP